MFYCIIYAIKYGVLQPLKRGETEKPYEQENQLTIMNYQNSEHKQIINVQSQKSIVVTFLLTILFNPLVMFYSTIVGGIVILIISVLIGIFTLGVSFLITLPICIIWAQWQQMILINNSLVDKQFLSKYSKTRLYNRIIKL